MGYEEEIPEQWKGGSTLTPIIQALDHYTAQGRARWHTPGHKGRFSLPYLVSEWDVTEVRELTPKSIGMDVIRQSEDLMAESFGVLKSRYSVQGATLPVMAAVMAASPPRSRVVVDRIAHQSVHSALVLGNLEPVWAYSSQGPGAYPLPVDDKERARLIMESRPQAVVVTNPTYEGLSAPLVETHRVCRELNIALIVDEAHGTHFFGHEGFPATALIQGADLVCHGAHKTEVSLTQTGILHINTSAGWIPRVQEAWDMLATSSPSYLLLASLDYLQYLRHHDNYHQSWNSLAKNMRQMWHTWENEGLFILQSWWERQGGQADPAKLTVVGDGQRLLDAMEPFGVEEKSDPLGVTLIVTPQDDTEVIARALEHCARTCSGGRLIGERRRLWPHARQVVSPYAAWHAEREWVPLSLASNRIAARSLIPYPPGIPIVVPGERIDSDVILWLEENRAWYPRRTGDLRGVEKAFDPLSPGRGEEGLWVVKEAVS